MDKIEFKDKLVSINRITKVVKGGRRFTFSALVVVGNYAGSVGVGYAKAKQVPNAIKKATQNAKKNLIKINGHPLVSYSIEAAKKSKLIKEVFVSTDGKAIAKVSFVVRFFFINFNSLNCKTSNSTILRL